MTATSQFSYRSTRNMRNRAVLALSISALLAAAGASVALNNAPAAQALPAAHESSPSMVPQTNFHDGPAPAGPAGRIYMPNPGENAVRVYDSATNQLLKSIPTGGGHGRPGVIAKSHDDKKLYVDNFRHFPATVTVIDRSKNDATKEIPVYSAPLGIFSSNDGKELYVPEEGGMVEIIDVETDKVVRQLRFPDIPVGAIAGPDGLMYIGFGSGYMAGVDPQTGKIVKPAIHLGGIGAFWYSFSADGTKMYADVVNSLAIVDMEKWQVVNRLHTAPDQKYNVSNPGAFISTLNPDGSRLYVSQFGRANVLVVDTATDKIIKEIPTSGFQTGIEFSPDGSRGYISDMGPDSLPWKGPIGEITLFGKLISWGDTGPNQIVVFDPKSDNVLGVIDNGSEGVGVPAVVGLPQDWK